MKHILAEDWRDILISRKRTADEITELKDKRRLKSQIGSSCGWDELSCVVSDVIIKTLNLGLSGQILPPFFIC